MHSRGSLNVAYVHGAFLRAFLVGGSQSKESACNAGDPGSIPGSAISPRGGNDNPLQYSCLVNSMDRRAWQAELDMTEQHTCTHTHTHTNGATHTHTHAHAHTHTRCNTHAHTHTNGATHTHTHARMHTHTHTHTHTQNWCFPALIPWFWLKCFSWSLLPSFEKQSLAVPDREAFPNPPVISLLGLPASPGELGRRQIPALNS